MRFFPVPKEREELIIELEVELELEEREELVFKLDLELEFEFEFEDGVSPPLNAEHRLLEIEEPIVDLGVPIRPSGTVPRVPKD